MRIFLLLLFLLPSRIWASVSGIDDINLNISPVTARKIDDAITTYYQNPTPQKVETVLDIMNDSDLLKKKTAWAPTIGFLTVVFANNKAHIFDWMSRNNYNQYAQSVFVAALLHARLKEAALVFAQAHQWKEADLGRLRGFYDPVELKHLVVRFPGHIDTVWGAFFASGDPVYVNEIIDVLFQSAPPSSTQGVSPQSPSAMLLENKKLAETTLRQYAPLHKPVREALEARIASEKDERKQQFLKTILVSAGSMAEGNHAEEENHLTVALRILAGLALLLLCATVMRRKGKLT